MSGPLELDLDEYASRKPPTVLTVKIDGHRDLREVELLVTSRITVKHMVTASRLLRRLKDPDDDLAHREALELAIAILRVETPAWRVEPLARWLGPERAAEIVRQVLKLAGGNIAAKARESVEAVYGKDSRRHHQNGVQTLHNRPPSPPAAPTVRIVAPPATPRETRAARRGPPRSQGSTDGEPAEGLAAERARMAGPPVIAFVIRVELEGPMSFGVLYSTRSHAERRRVWDWLRRRDDVAGLIARLADLLEWRCES
jgi:hypothetical protein